MIPTSSGWCLLHRLGVAASHDTAVITRLADRGVVTEPGRIIEQGPIGQVVGNPARERSRLLIGRA